VPWLAYLVATIAFVGFSLYLFYKTEYATIIYLLIALAVTAKFSEARRNEFLTICFGNNKKRNLRILENMLVILPFLAFLGYKKQLFYSLILLVTAVVMALVNLHVAQNIVIPTPFYKKPFEFAVGFRNSFYIIIAAYGLAVVAVGVDNFNLGIFAMLLVFVVSLGFYTRPENEYYVWISSKKPPGFLVEKIKIATIYVSFLALPIAVALAWIYPSYWHITLLFTVIGYLFLWNIILAKYAAYPGEMNLPEGILIAISISFPPLLLALIPLFYSKSVKKLNLLLK
jgi:hypothetical protein